MKKIVSMIFVVVFLSSNISFVIATYDECIQSGISPALCAEDFPQEDENTNTENTNQVDEEIQCNSPLQTDPTSNYTTCCMPSTDNCMNYEKGDSLCSYEENVYNLCTTETPIQKPTKCTPVMGITCCEEELVNGQCKLNIYDTLGIRQSVRDKDDPTSVGLFVQDVVLSATFFIGTLVTIALIVSGLMFIFAASSGKDPANAKQGIMGSLIGLLIVVSSYVIIRLVQYIAKGF